MVEVKSKVGPRNVRLAWGALGSLFGSFHAVAVALQPTRACLYSVHELSEYIIL